MRPTSKPWEIADHSPESRMVRLAQYDCMKGTVMKPDTVGLRQLIVTAALCLSLSAASAVSAQVVKAFPTAQGFGANARGGRGGRVIEVTNHNDSGKGSLRNAMEASGPRICVFRVSGTITLKSAIRVSSPYLTVAGRLL